MPEGIPGHRPGLEAALDRCGALGHHDDREAAPAFVAATQVGDHLLDVERPLGHEDRVRPAGETRVRGDPSGVPAHHLDHHHPVVGLGRGVQPVDRIGDDLHGRLKAERHVGPGQVVVDRLGNAHDRDPLLVQSQGHTERVLAADRDQRVHAPCRQRVADCRRSVLPLGERVRARGAEDGAPAREDPGGGLKRQLARLVGEHARPAGAKPHEAVPAGEPPAHDRADDRVQAGAVAAPGQHPYASHARSPVRAIGRILPDRRISRPAAGARSPVPAGTRW